jgi:hypothetical protein
MWMQVVGKIALAQAPPWLSRFTSLHKCVDASPAARWAVVRDRIQFVTHQLVILQRERVSGAVH